MGELAHIFLDVCLPVFALAGIGFVLDRALRFDLKTLVRLNIYLAVPCFIFVKVVSAEGQGAENWKAAAFTLCMVFLVGVLSTAVARISKLDPPRAAGLRLTTMFYNCGNYGIPMVALAFGEAALETQVFVLMTMNVSVFTLGLLMASPGDHSIGRRAFAILKQPSIWAISSALLVRAFGLPVQEVTAIWKPMGLVADALVALALFTLGVQMSQTKPPPLVGALSWALVIRLVAAPLLALALVPFFNFDPPTAAVLIFIAGAPTAVNTALLAHEMGGDWQFTTAGVFYSTLLVIGTSTLALWLLRTFYLAV